MPDRTHTITLTLTVSDADGDGVWVVTDDLGDAYGDGENPALAIANHLSYLAEELRRADHDQYFTKFHPGARQWINTLIGWSKGERP